MTEEIVQRAWICIGVGTFLAAVGTALLAFARHADAKNWILQRAPLLPLDLLNARDDAWVRGEVQCDTPLHVPHFGEPCVAYDYLEEEKVTEVIDEQGGSRRTRTRWEGRQHRVEAIEFEIAEGDGAIRIHADEADLQHLPRLGYEMTHAGRIRHSARYLPCPSTASALGCVSDHADWLEKHENIPLLVTPKTRAELIESAERSESALRWSGHAALLLGLVAVLYGAALKVGFPSDATAAWSAPHAVLAAIAGVTLFVSAWTLYTFNTMLTYRLRTRTAWHQIDIDLKNRFDLVPRLVEVVRGAVAHEQELLSRLAAMRAGATDHDAIIARERGATDAVRELVRLKEEYPDLGTRPLFAKLHRELVALEEKIAHDRVFYDDCATEFNSYITELPRTWLASMCDFEEEPLFRDAGRKLRPKLRVVGPRR